MTMDRTVVYHDAAFAVIGRALNIAIRPPDQRCGLRLFEGDVFAAQDRSAEELEQMAVVAFAGRIALNGYQQGAQGDRDELMGKDLVFHGALARYGYDMRPEFVPRGRTDRRGRVPRRRTLECDRGRSRPAPRRSTAPSGLTWRQTAISTGDLCAILARRARGAANRSEIAPAA